MNGAGINPIRQQKDELRALWSARRREMDPAEKQRRDEALCRVAVGLVSFRYAEYVLLYSAMEYEINVNAIAEAALAKGKKIAFPRCDPATHTMQYHFVTSLDELETGAYGITEPSADAPVYDPDASQGSAVCFVPGLVYDRKGYRLGYGKGFYDRYLSRFSGCSLGVVYSDYILPAVPRGRYDVSVNILLTEKGVKMTGEN